MPAPASITYDDLVKVDAHTALRDYIDQGTGAGKLVLYSEADVALATFTLADPCGTVNGTTGQLTFSAISDVNGSADGTCTWAQCVDSDDNRAFDIPVQTGTSAVSGYLVLNTANIVSGAPISIISAVIG